MSALKLASTNVVALTPQKQLQHLSNPSYPVSHSVHDQLHELCGVILDNWRLVSAMHTGIASTVMGWTKPAERVSQKQMYRLAEAAAILGVLDRFQPEVK